MGEDLCFQPCDSSAFTVLAELRRCGLTDSETCLKSLTLILGGGHMVSADPGAVGGGAHGEYRPWGWGGGAHGERRPWGWGCPSRQVTSARALDPTWAAGGPGTARGPSH